ncbi:MAG: DUF4185 domain-containing protein [Pseudomonadota bacterium]
MNIRLAASGLGMAGLIWLIQHPAHAPAATALQASVEPGVALSPDASGLRVGRAEVIRQLTGAASLNDTAARWNVHGTDLGHMFRHGESLYMVFGDTYGPDGGAWRSNAMARIDNPDPRAGLAFAGMVEGPDGAAGELIGSSRIPGLEWTVIPTYGVSLGERMVLHYMSVRMWTSDGRWLVRRSGLAYSDDEGRSWRRSDTALWPNGMGFEQVAFVERDDMIYAFGIPQGRFGPVRLRRVARASMFDPAAYQYWNGRGWTADPGTAAPVVPAPAGELSVAWSEAHERWLMMYLDEVRAAVVLRSAPELTGPWSEAQVVAQAADFPGLYAPYIVPGSESDEDIHFVMSRWKPVYNVFLMKAPLEARTPVGAAPEGNGSEDAAH